MKTRIPLHRWTRRVAALANLPLERNDRFSRFLSPLPLFSTKSLCELHLSVAEGYLCLPRLKSIQFEVFPYRNNADDNYLEYIPLAWTTNNNLRGGFLAPNLLWEMMVISMLNYQADEYMEIVSAVGSVEGLQSIKATIDKVCEVENCSMTVASINDYQALAKSCMTKIAHMDALAQKSKPDSRQNSGSYSSTNISNTILGSFLPASASRESIFHTFVTPFKTHPTVVRASSNDRSALLHEIKKFLLAQLAPGHTKPLSENYR